MYPFSGLLKRILEYDPIIYTTEICVKPFNGDAPTPDLSYTLQKPLLFCNCSYVMSALEGMAPKILLLKIKF
jgi:hypothetical protein